MLALCWVVDTQHSVVCLLLAERCPWFKAKSGGLCYSISETLKIIMIMMVTVSIMVACMGSLPLAIPSALHTLTHPVFERVNEGGSIIIPFHR